VATTSRVTPWGWEQGDDSADSSRVTPGGWEQVEGVSTGATGTLAYTNSNDTSAASGTTTVVGTSNTTNAADTSAAIGTTTVTGTLATTNADDTVVASGAAGAITGTVAYTNADDSIAADGWAGLISGTVAYTNADDTSSASGEAGSELIGRKYQRRGRTRPRKTLELENIPEVIEKITKEKEELSEELAAAQADLVSVQLMAHNSVNRAKKIKELSGVINTLEQNLDTAREEEVLLLLACMALEN